MKRLIKISFVVCFFLILFILVNTALKCREINGGLFNPVQTKSGLVSGVKINSTPPVLVYKGIPFAASPVGKLRWKEPQPASPWLGVRKCTEFGPACIQPNSETTPKNQSEDCLYLNIWTPAKSPKDKLPVMVWIHGGGFVSGAGSLDMYCGQSLAQKGVVVVSINYRLGPFGFLAHRLLSKESPHNSSGNYGLLDQIQALKWVRDNIKAFGGNPNNVTIFGESAGSYSVCSLMASPLSRGLFHKVIAESGGLKSSNYILPKSPGPIEFSFKTGELLAKNLGCGKEKDVISAMRGKSAEEIMKAAGFKKGSNAMQFSICFDGWVMPKEGLASVFKNNRQHDVPLIIGTNKDEGTMFYYADYKGKMSLKEYKNLLKSFFGDNAQNVFKLFPAEKEKDVYQAFNKFLTVAAFAEPARFTASSMGKKKSKAYLYRFNRLSNTEFAKKLGVAHGSEIPYVFGTFGTFAKSGYGKVDNELSAKIQKYWINFAKTGNPNSHNLPVWPVYNSNTDQNIEFGDKITVKSGLYKKQCDELDKITNSFK